MHAIKYNITQIVPFKRLFLWNSAQGNEHWMWSWSKVCEVWLPFLALAVLSVWDSALISTQCQTNIIIYVSGFMKAEFEPTNYSLERTMFKFLRGGSRDDDSEIHLDGLCDLFSKGLRTNPLLEGNTLLPFIYPSFE